MNVVFFFLSPWYSMLELGSMDDDDDEGTAPASTLPAEVSDLPENGSDKSCASPRKSVFFCKQYFVFSTCVQSGLSPTHRMGKLSSCTACDWIPVAHFNWDVCSFLRIRAGGMHVHHNGIWIQSKTSTNKICSVLSSLAQVLDLEMRHWQVLRLFEKHCGYLYFAWTMHAPSSWVTLCLLKFLISCWLIFSLCNLQPRK